MMNAECFAFMGSMGWLGWLMPLAMLLLIGLDWLGLAWLGLAIASLAKYLFSRSR